MLYLFLSEQEEIPWKALIYVFGHINYGGRVTDDNDRETLIKTLEKYCNSDTIKDGYKLSPLPTYYVPADGNMDVYRDYIESLPINDSPEIFGMHENANITYNQQESYRVIETILSIQPRVTGGAGGMTPDEIVTGKARELLEQLPINLDHMAEGVKKELFHRNAQGLIPSFSTVLVQELTKFNLLLNTIRKSLEDIDLAIQGFIVMSDTLDSMYLRIQNNQVPSNWEKVAYPSLKPLSSWFSDLIIRIQFFDDWLKNGNPNSYWMSGFFFPQGFMTGVLQTHSRQYRIEIDKLSFGF
jgi:dynein heavy chain